MRWPLRSRVAAGLVVVAVAGFIALGLWQLARREWKLALIARVEQRIHAAPVAPPMPAQWPRMDAADDEYRRLLLQGRFLHDRETLVRASTVAGPGWWVLTPLQTRDNGIVLVNRGYVPSARRDPATRRVGRPEGQQSVVGLLRMSEVGGGFLRRNRPADDRWYSRDVMAIAARRGLSGVAPFFVDAEAVQGAGPDQPLGGLTVVRFRNTHLSYALTWFAMAGLLCGAAILAARTRRGG